MGPSHDSSFLKEVWGLFIVGASILFIRFAIRLRTVGWRNFQGDDLASLFVLGCYTADAITVTITYHNGTNVDYTQEQLIGFSEDKRQDVIYGSKMQVLAWFTYSTLIWALKATMLFFFNRLTTGLGHQKFVKWLGAVVAASYVAVFLTILLGCYPTNKNWQIIPDPGSKCTVRLQNLYVVTLLNVVTDAAILCIPLPLLWRLKVSISKKLSLGLLLSSGLFVITAAIIRLVLTLEGSASATTLNRWGVRETIVGILAVNVPILRPLFTKAFWSWSYSGSESTPMGASGPSSAPFSKRSNYIRSNPFSNASRTDRIELTSNPNIPATKSRHGVHVGEVYDMERDETHADTSSQDFIISKEGKARSDSSDDDLERGLNGGVMVETTYHVKREEDTTSTWGDRPNDRYHVKIEAQGPGSP